MAWCFLSTQMQPLAAVFTTMFRLYTNIISCLSLSPIEIHKEIVQLQATKSGAVQK
jgi:hypothetical protein